MRRSTAILRVLLLTCTLLVAIGVSAAPAPIYKPTPNMTWVTGWDQPVDPIGDCGFSRKGDKLTIRVPGITHCFMGDRDTSPQLLRDIEGDFDVEVRVEGDFNPANPLMNELSKGAGLLITDGLAVLRFGRYRNENGGIRLEATTRGCSAAIGESEVGCALKPTYLRVERRANVLTVKYRTNRGEWSAPLKSNDPFVIAFPKKLKVGVFAESAVPGVFEPVFDKFVLTPLK